jgi:ketosteroid isomerase-like protein
LRLQETFKAELKELLVSENGRVIAIHHNSAVRNGKRLDTGCCVVFDVKDGPFIEGREHFNFGRALSGE